MPFKSPLAAPMICLAAGLTLAGCNDTAGEDAGSDPAADGETGAIEQRQSNFEEIGDSFKVIRDQLEGSDPDWAAIVTAAETIQADAAKIPDFFPAGTGIDSGADTEALATIWEQPDDFAAAHDRLTTAAAGLVTAAQAAEVAGMEAAVGQLGGACKNCHDTFRLDDD